MCHRVEERDVRAGPHREITRSVVRELSAPRINDDETCAAQHGLFDARAEDRMVLSGICPTHQNGPGALDIVERAGREAGTKDLLQCCRTRRVADPGTAVDVVGADDSAGELLREIVILVRCARGSEDADTVGSVLLNQLAQPPGDEGPRLVPRDTPPILTIANHRLRDAVGGRHEVERGTAP